MAVPMGQGLSSLNSAWCYLGLFKTNGVLNPCSYLKLVTHHCEDPRARLVGTHTQHKQHHKGGDQTHIRDHCGHVGARNESPQIIPGSGVRTRAIHKVEICQVNTGCVRTCMCIHACARARVRVNTHTHARARARVQTSSARVVCAFHVH